MSVSSGARSRAYDAMFRKESKEHPWADRKTIGRIVEDHMKEKKR